MNTFCRPLLKPAPLHPGDTIAILSPATTVKSEYIEGAVKRLTSMGYNVEVMPSASGPADGSYAASEESRMRDLVEAFSRSDIRAVLCARGGYGAVHLIEKISLELLRSDPKWVIGYSDISALHAMMQRAGIVSLHAPMAKHLTIEPSEDYAVLALNQILQGLLPLTYHVEPHSYNVAGKATGVLRGGNLAVLAGLIGTPFDILTPAPDEDMILFIEDISEAIYSTERMLFHLHLNGALSRLRGLIVGQFTETRADKNFADTQSMIHSRLSRFGLEHIPVAFNFPVGHVSNNYPLIEGCRCTLSVCPDKVELIQSL